MGFTIQINNSSFFSYFYFISILKNLKYFVKRNSFSCKRIHCQEYVVLKILTYIGKQKEGGRDVNEFCARGEIMYKWIDMIWNYWKFDRVISGKNMLLRRVISILVTICEKRNFLTKSKNLFLFFWYFGKCSVVLREIYRKFQNEWKYFLKIRIEGRIHLV